MAKNPFISVSDVTRKIGKNYYDWSHDYNFTGKIGTIYPVFAKYCPAGTSLSMDAIAGLQFMPMQFPVQSKMKLKLSFWRMPLRAMWKDYTNLVSSQNQPDVQKNYVAPFIDFNHSGAYTDMLAVGGLCDYLRIPCVLRSSLYNAVQSNMNPSQGSLIQCSIGPFVVGTSITFASVDQPTVGVNVEPTRAYAIEIPADIAPETSPTALQFLGKIRFLSAQAASNAMTALGSNLGSFFQLKVLAVAGTGSKMVVSGWLEYKLRLDGDTIYLECDPGKFVGLLQGFAETNRPKLYVLFPNREYVFTYPNSDYAKTTPLWVQGDCRLWSDGYVPVDKNSSPFYDSSSENSQYQKALSAYPFRMYEAIYNAYIRYIRNNPFKKNGKAVYNEWLPTMEGGADTTPYKLHRCNWAADAYTTAVQSPQQGVAPVVGLSQATVLGEDGVSRVVPAITTEDGKSYGIEFKANEFGLEGVDYTELGTGAKVAPVHSMYSLAQSGISIDDFRMTNAYQRYLELNMMRGYSYKQIVEGRFEVNVKYDDLLMPEFCGGMTRDVFMSGVQQNVEDNGGSGTYVGSLGSEAGVAGCRGELGHKVKIYCDEPSYVMVLAYVVPQSIYSQICPKDFLYRDLLDAWSPEFDQIGFQPIRASELFPVQQFAFDKSGIDNIFGFQRPWYEYCEVPDASVGLFNTELSNFLMHRVFSGVPQLGEKFTTVNHESVDHVFSVTEFTDKFFGQIHFSIDVKSPVSRVVIPSLE